MRFRRAIVVGIIVLASAAPAISLAAGLPDQIVPTDCNKAGGCQSICDLAELANNILNAVIYFAVFMSAILFAWAGVMYVTAQGNPGKVAKAKNIIWYVAIGLVIILAAYLIVQTLMAGIADSNIFGNWNTLCGSA